LSTLLLAFGLMMVIEGLAYALAPSLVTRLLEALRALPPDAIRQIGLLIAITGAVLIWLVFTVM